jgi:pyruvate, orthophosphate dikinase
MSTPAPTIVSFGSGMVLGATPSAAAMGNKAAMLAGIAALGLPVPPGFVMRADLCRAVADKAADAVPPTVMEALHAIEQATGRKLGAPALPLFLALRASAAALVPGTGDAVLNLGLNDDTVEALARDSADLRFAYDAYCRFIQNYAQVVMGDDPAAFEDVLALYMEERGYVSDTELQGSDMRELSTRFKAQFESNNGEGFPQDPLHQFRAGCAALQRAWHAPRAKTHRKLHGLGEEAGLATMVQAMVNGLLGSQSGVGRLTTRHAQTGNAQMAGEFLPNAQGPDLVARLRKSVDMAGFQTTMPAAHAELTTVLEQMEHHLRDGLDVEFALEAGHLWLITAKPCRRSAQAALHMALDMAGKGLLSREEALLRIDPLSLDKLLHSTIDPDEKRTVIATGLPASPGAVSGLVVFDADEARDLADQGRRVILVRPETLPEDIRGLHAAEGVLTTRGGMTSHAAVIARGMGKPCVAGASTLKIDTAAGTLAAPGLTLRRHDVIRWMALRARC